MKQTKVAVIGLGNMGRFHAKTYAELPSADLVAVYDLNAERAQEYATTYNCQAYSDLSSLLNDTSIEAVTIASPTSTHYEVAKICLNHNKHCLIEKPIAETQAEAEELQALAKAKGKTLMVGHIEQFNPVFLTLKAFLETGKAGRILSIETKRMGLLPPQIKDANVILDLAVHDIGIICDIVGETPQKLNASAGKALLTDRPDYAEIQMTFSNIISHTSVNWITPKRVRTLTIHGTKGYIEMDFIAQDLNFYPITFNGESFPLSEPESIPVTPGMPLTNELGHFIDCIQTQKTPKISGPVGTTALTLALDAISQIQSA